jgi:hypothetical protein
LSRFTADTIKDHTKINYIDRDYLKTEVINIAKSFGSLLFKLAGKCAAECLYGHAATLTNLKLFVMP